MATTTGVRDLAGQLGDEPLGRGAQAVRARTSLPALTLPPLDPATDQGKRPGAFTRTDVLNLVGSAGAAAGVTSLLFGRIAPMSGLLGALIIGYVVFLLVYALLVSLTDDGTSVKNKFMTVMMTTAAILLIGALAFVVVYALVGGWEALPHPNFFLEDMSLAGPLQPLTVGGIAHAIVGTLIEIGIALLITVPLGIACAVFLNEVGGGFARFVRTIVEAMTALPSVVAGLFIFAAVVLTLGFERSGFAASLALTVMMLPIVIRSADVVLRLVAGNLREAALALGATQWRTVWNVVLPTARSGIATAVILGTARGIGETSPVLLTAGMTSNMNVNPFSGPMVSLPLQVFDFVRSPQHNYQVRGFGTAAVLMALVLLLFILARAVGGRGPGEVSERQRRRLARASAQDASRLVGRDFPPAPAPTAAPDVPPVGPAGGWR